MNTYTVEKTDRSITLGFKDVNLTLVTPLVSALNQDKNVNVVRFIDQHPELCDRMLYVEVKKGKPEDAVKKAVKTLSDTCSGIKG